MSLSYACLQLGPEEPVEAARERIIYAVTVSYTHLHQPGIPAGKFGGHGPGGRQTHFPADG